MKCPQDNTEMQEGWFTQGIWMAGAMKKLSWWVHPVISPLYKGSMATTWRCPKCGKLEFYTAPDIKE